MLGRSNYYLLLIRCQLSKEINTSQDKITLCNDIIEKLQRSIPERYTAADLFHAKHIQVFKLEMKDFLLFNLS